MEEKNILGLSRTDTDLNSRISDLILGRVLKKAYLEFDEKIKESIKEILTSHNKNKRAAKKYIPDIKLLFEQEAKNIEKEIKAEIEKQILKN